MKICYVGANAPRLVNLMADMQERGHEVHWIALDSPEYAVPGITIHDSIRLFGRNVVGRCLLTPFFLFLFKNIVKKISPDLLHAINVEWAGWFTVLSGLNDTIVTTQGGDVMIRPKLKNTIFHKYLRRYTLNNAAVVTYGNNAMLQDINHWATPKKAFKNFAGVNFDLFDFKKSPSKLQQKMGLGKKKVVLSPRMFEQNSNLDILVKTIPIVKKEFPDILYIFTCHLEINNYSIRVKELIRELDVGKNCWFLSDIYPDEMPDIYSISDVVISILSSDGMPATLFEAMAMKKPLVISNIPSYTGLMDEKYALIVENKDVKSTAKAIIKALMQDKEIVQLEEIAYDWARRNGDFRKLNDSLEKLYFEIVQTKR